MRVIQEEANRKKKKKKVAESVNPGPKPPGGAVRWSERAGFAAEGWR